MRYPALDVSNAEAGLVLAVAEDYPLTAAQEHASFITLFFSDATARLRAHEGLARAFPNARISHRDVDDEDWARRSQRGLSSVAVGRFLISPPWAATAHPEAGGGGPGALPMWIVIEPSTGFGTGHHATTRLCLTAMQTLDLSGTTVLDIGTGSGVLALAASLLGAKRVTAIDPDPDAIRNAGDNLRFNPQVDNVVFECVDLATIVRRQATHPMADVVVANVTGALLAREADAIVGLLRPHGQLVVSGLLRAERPEVARAFQNAGDWGFVWEREEDEWIGAVIQQRLDPPGSDDHAVQ